MIRHYRSADGIIGYAVGDVLVCDDTGECSLVVRTGAGVQLEPVRALTEDGDFDDAGDVRSIRWRLHPLDVGFDLRAERMTVSLEDDIYPRVSYAEDGARRVIAGPRALVIARLRAAGYEVAP